MYEYYRSFYDREWESRLMWKAWFNRYECWWY